MGSDVERAAGVLAELPSNPGRGLEFSGAQPGTCTSESPMTLAKNTVPHPQHTHLGPTDSEHSRWARHVCSKCSP